MIPTPNSCFTATQIARAAGLTRQAVHAGLAKVAPAGEGTPASCWGFSDLPIDWQLAIAKRGVMRGFENGEHYLRNLPAPWKCPLPWGQGTRANQDKAVKLQRVFIRDLEFRASPAVTAAQADAASLEDFKKQFGYPINERTWRRLRQRTLERDAGEENWQRLEIYLDDRALKPRKASQHIIQNEYKHQELDSAITALESRETPTAQDRAFIWDKIFTHYEDLTEKLADAPMANRERRSIKASLLHYLFQAFPAGTLCASSASLKHRFDEKLAQWRAKGRTAAAVMDNRKNSGRVAPKLCVPCRTKRPVKASLRRGLEQVPPSRGADDFSVSSLRGAGLERTEAELVSADS